MSNYLYFPLQLSVTFGFLFTAKFMAGVINTYHPSLHFSSLASVPLTLECAQPPRSVRPAKFILLCFLRACHTTDPTSHFLETSWFLLPQHPSGFPPGSLSFSISQVGLSSFGHPLDVVFSGFCPWPTPLSQSTDSHILMPTPLSLMTPSHLNPGPKSLL